MIQNLLKISVEHKYLTVILDRDITEYNFHFFFLSLRNLWDKHSAWTKKKPPSAFFFVQKIYYNS